MSTTTGKQLFMALAILTLPLFAALVAGAVQRQSKGIVRVLHATFAPILNEPHPS